QTPTHSVVASTKRVQVAMASRVSPAATKSNAPVASPVQSDDTGSNAEQDHDAELGA
ncbi:MAG: hypothetical protein QOH33_683, partial [Paraburkholderia sp.]|nr:hypothetical protein [Paraburkholderia sp.]